MIQAKLAINAPRDPYEQEADRVAGEVMRMPDSDGAAGVRRDLETSKLQRPCPECEGKGGSEKDEIDGHVESEIRSLRSGGSPLPETERAFFEPRFGHDFAAVRVHTGSRAARLARSVNAHAFALGRDIVFGSGRYSPGTAEGRHLLAHELTHVVQQERVQPHVQRLTITQHSFHQGDCGERNVQWVFSLDSAATEDGYIVQQVDASEYIKTCPDLAIGPAAPTQKFWEAWLVKKGDKVDWTTVRDKWTDGSTRPGRPGTNGTQISAGVVKFFTRKTTGDLGDFGTAPADPKSAWGPGKVPTSGSLPSTPSKPSWWDGTAVEGPVNREAMSVWNCCDADKSKHTSKVTAKP